MDRRAAVGPAGRRIRAGQAAWPTGAWIGTAYWFTSSTAFANPAVTIGRTPTSTYAGIAPASAPAFVAAEILGGALGTAVAVIINPVQPHQITRASQAGRLIRKGHPYGEVPQALFVCTHNAGRSQLAAALLDQHAAGRAQVTSAGSQPPASSTQTWSRPWPRLAWTSPLSFPGR